MTPDRRVLLAVSMGVAMTLAIGEGRQQVAPSPATSQPDQAAFTALAERIDPYVAKPRLVVLTDIANEPDDQMSFVRLLVYSNQFDLEALIATTSRHLRNGPRPDVLLSVIDAYAKVQPNLLKHQPGFPPADALRKLVVPGQEGYGMASVGDGRMTAGAEAIIRAADSTDSRPVWITVWGGPNTLAQALWHVRATRSAAELEKLVSKLRVYTISDQDDAGPWLRREFPTLHYIATPGDGADYHVATWTGLAGDEFYRNAPGADFTTVSEPWLNEHVRSKGPLGANYPLPCCMIEGDTPSFLSLIDNGLVAYMNPTFGGWGGRYIWRQPWLESRPYWTNGRTSRDTVVGTDGKSYTSDQATIWRWRQAYMHDFAARMAWTVSEPSGTNHNPQVTVNAIPGKAPVIVDAKVGTPLKLDASGSSDPDRHALRYEWLFYPEAGTSLPSANAQGRGQRAGGPAGATGAAAPGTQGTPGRSTGVPSAPPGGRPAPTPRITVSDATNAIATVMPTVPGSAHVIVAVTDNGSPSLTSYRRVIVTIQPADR